MENRIIQITPTIIGVVVPSNFIFFELPDMQLNPTILYCYSEEIRGELLEIKISDECNNFFYKIHGICTLPSLYFDFEIDKSWVTDNNTFGYPNYLYSNKGEVDFLCPTPKESFRTRIQKAIQDEGLLLVNPYDIKGQTFSNEHQNKWQESESKVIRGKLLIIEKI